MAVESLDPTYKEAACIRKMEIKLMLAASFASVLVPLLGGLPFIVDLWGETEGGKTVTLMVAASVWSLLIPAIEQFGEVGAVRLFPGVCRILVRRAVFACLDHLIPHLHVGSEEAEGPKSRLGRTTMMVLAVTLHNIPEAWQSV